MAETPGPRLSTYPSFKRSLQCVTFRRLCPSLRDKIEEIMELVGSTKMKELDERWAKYYAKADIYLQQIREYHGEQIRIFTDAIASSSKKKETTPLPVDLDLDLDLELSRYPVFEATLSRGGYHPSVLSRETAKMGMGSVGSTKIAELDERWSGLKQKISEQMNGEMDPLISEQHKILADALACLASSSNSK